MRRFGDRDMVAVALAVAGVVGALSLAGIFIVYLIDTIGDDDGASSGQVQPAGSTGLTGSTGPALPSLGATGAQPGIGDGAESPAGAGGEEAAGGNNPRLNRIPDNQVYETFRNSSAGYSIEFPKGWETSGRGSDVRFSFRRNVERIVASDGRPQTTKQVSEALSKNEQIDVVSAPRYVNIGGERVIKTTFQRLGITQGSGAPVRLLVDQYRYFSDGKVAVLDLATTGAVRRFNADDYERISRSFRWL